MSAPTTSANPYDEFPYPSQPLPQARPDRLAALATLFGLSPAPADQARVLELGCGIGSNLIALAEAHPRGKFLGIDYSLVQIEAGRRCVAELGLENVELVHASIAELGSELGQFDYIICHGVFSWVTSDLQDRIFQTCQSLLAPQGVAFISYNLYPGWFFRSILRDVLFEYTSPELPPRERVRAGRKVMEFLQRASARNESPFARLLQHEMELTLNQNDGYLYHEFLERENHPCSFDIFLTRAAGFGLQYVSDAAPATMFVMNFGPKIEQSVLAIAQDLVSSEIHLDALRNRAFRQSLLCHAGLRVAHQLTIDPLRSLFFSGRLYPVNSAFDITSSTPEKFSTPQGLSVSTPTPVAKAAMLYLGQQWPRVVALDELFAGAEQLLAKAGTPCTLAPTQRTGLSQNLIQCIASGLIEISSLPDQFVTTVSDRPQASRMARWQSRDADLVTNRRHELVTLDPVARMLLPALDGQHTRDDLLAVLSAATERGELSVLVGGGPVADLAGTTRGLELKLAQELATLASQALLVS